MNPYDTIITAVQRLEQNGPKVSRPSFFMTGFEVGALLAIRYPEVAQQYLASINEAVHDNPGQVSDFINYLCAEVQTT